MDCAIHVAKTKALISCAVNAQLMCAFPVSVIVQTSLCRTWSETPNTGFLMQHLIVLPIATAARLSETSVPWNLVISPNANSSMSCSFFSHSITVSVTSYDRDKPLFPSRTRAAAVVP